MHDGLEFPNSGGVEDWNSMYRAREDEVEPHRPIFTGDIFSKVPVHGVGQKKNKTVMILQHPCALRTDGVSLHPRIAVAEVRTHTVISADSWNKHLSKMPLPDLVPSVNSGRKNQAAFFDEVYLAAPDDLDLDKRIACLSQSGVNLLLQRWVHHNSRVVVPTRLFQKASALAFEEAELIEEWCAERAGGDVTLNDAAIEALKWLREDAGSGSTRQQRLEDPQQRSSVRKEMRLQLRSLRQDGK